MPVDPEMVSMKRIIEEISILMNDGHRLNDFSKADEYIRTFDYMNATDGEITAVLRTPVAGRQYLPSWQDSVLFAKECMIKRGMVEVEGWDMFYGLIPD